MTTAITENAVYFHNGQPYARRQILDDLERHAVPAFARDAYLASLVPYDEEAHALFESKDDGYEPLKSNPLHERKAVGIMPSGRTKYHYRNVKTKQEVPASEVEGIRTDRAVTDADVKDANPKAVSSDAIKQAHETVGVQGDKNRSAEAKDAQKKFEEQGAVPAVQAVGKMLDALHEQYAARGDKAAIDVISSGPTTLGKLKSWVGKKVDSALTEATSWMRAMSGGGDSDQDVKDPDVKSSKGWVSTMVRGITNPLVEWPKALTGVLFADSKRWRFADHDSKKLEKRWGPKIANLVVASGAALGVAAAATGLAAGLAGGGLGVAAAGAGAAAMCHYCPVFRAFVARFPAKLLLTVLNKTGHVDDLDDKARAKRASEDKKAQGNAKAKGDFETAASAAGFADAADPDDKGKDLSPEKILEIAKEFWTDFYKKFWKAVLTEPKLKKAFAKLGAAHAKDPAALALGFADVNSKVKLPRGKAAEFADCAQPSDFLDYDVLPGKSYRLDGKRVSFSAARSKLLAAGLEGVVLERSLLSLPIA